MRGFIDPIDTAWANAKRVSAFGRAVYNWDFSEYSEMGASDWGLAGATRLGEAGGIIGGCYVSLERLAISGGAKVLRTVGATKVASAAYNTFKKNCAAPAAAAISRNWSLLKNKAQGWYSKVFPGAKQLEKQVTQTLPDGHMWTRASPFKNKTTQELDAMFYRKGFRRRGLDPINGKGNYINPKNKRQYHIDPNNIGRYREPNHVDVERLDDYIGNLEKKRFGYLDD